MAADQARDPHSGILVASCGDAHISNFGFYASPQRTLLFDLNDFDEAAWAPWEWDLERLVTSVVIGGRASGRDESFVQEAARAAAEAYVRTLRLAGKLSPLERYYAHLAPESTRLQLDKASRKALRRATEDARRRTGERASGRLTELDGDDRRRFRENPPLTTHLAPDEEIDLRDDVRQYLRSANVDIRLLVSQYSLDDLVRRVVGVGSVGTRCFLALLSDSQGRPMILQVKEAGRRVIEEFGAIPQPDQLVGAIGVEGEGARVVAMQRILQAYSDPFLGHLRSQGGYYYVRQFHDMKGSVEVETLKDVPFHRYGATCAAILARAHAQSPRLAEVLAFIGKGERGMQKTTRGIVAWANAYAEISLADYHAFR